MKGNSPIMLTGLASAGLVLCGSTSALANGPATLTDGQLDRVTAGGAYVGSSSDAAAAGVLTLTATSGNSIVTPEPSPYPGQPGLAPAGGAADGTALAVGTNLSRQGEPPSFSGTSVATGGSANGNQVVNSTINQTVQGAGGVTFQVGWTFVYGAWVGL
jgi:hypothetical protein